MPKNPKVDAYIAKQPESARLIMEKLRKAFHKGCPQLEEKIKWGIPSFEYKGMMVGFGGFKKHVSWGFWKASIMDDPDGILGDKAKASPMSNKVTDVKELPTQAVIVKYVKQAAKLNDEGVKPTKKQRTKPELKAPSYLTGAIKKNKDAQKHWKAFTPAKRREYIEWVTGAKQEATREKRLKQTVEWVSEGKPRNWKYMDC